MKGKGVLLVNTMGCCECHFRMDKGTSTLVLVYGRAMMIHIMFSQHCHHPGELSKLSLVIQITYETERNTLNTFKDLCF
jgi:hypothetical protein